MAWVVTAVVAAFEVGATAAVIFTAVSEVGMAMSVVGAVTGNKDLMKIGGVLGLAGGIGGAAAGGMFGESVASAVNSNVGSGLATAGAQSATALAADNMATNGMNAGADGMLATSAPVLGQGEVASTDLSGSSPITRGMTGGVGGQTTFIPGAGDTNELTSLGGSPGAAGSNTADMQRQVTNWSDHVPAEAGSFDANGKWTGQAPVKPNYFDYPSAAEPSALTGSGGVNSQPTAATTAAGTVQPTGMTALEHLDSIQPTNPQAVSAEMMRGSNAAGAAGATGAGGTPWLDAGTLNKPTGSIFDKAMAWAKDLPPVIQAELAKSILSIPGGIQAQNNIARANAIKQQQVNQTSYNTVPNYFGAGIVANAMKKGG